jgi:hypothetical protein
MYCVFLVFAILHTLFYTIFRHGIFEWNADPSPENRAILKVKRDIIEGKIKNDKPPFGWTVDYYLQVFLGVATGWVFLWILTEKRINLFDKPDFANLGVADLILFLLGWIGINGRLLSIAHGITDLMRSGASLSVGNR